MLSKSKILLAAILLLAAGCAFLFLRFGLNDSRSLANFSAAYLAYDRAIASESSSVLSNPTAAADQEQAARKALADLKTKSSARISSLTRSDGDLMTLMPEIAGLSAKELDALTAYRQAAADQAAEMDALSSTFRALTTQRKAAYARFLTLSGQ